MMRMLKRLAGVFRSGPVQAAEDRPSWRPGTPGQVPEAQQPKRFSTLLPGGTHESDLAGGAQNETEDAK